MRLEKVRLGDICIFENGDRGKNYPSQTAFISEGIPFINAGNLNNNLIDNKGVNYISEDHFNRLSNGKVQINDILFCLRGSLGKYAINTSIEKGAIASSLVILRAKDNIYYKFLSYFLSTPAFKEMVDKANNGSSQPNLSASSVKDFKISLPPLPQQQKIANILDAADALRQNDKALIAKYDELTQALFLDMFGDPVSNPKGLEKVKFLDLFNIETGKLDSNHSVINGKYPFFTCAKDVLAINSFSYDKEALLLAGNNAAGVYDVKHYIGKFDAYQRTYILTLDPTLRSYLFYKLHLELKLKDLQKLSIGSSTKYLTMKIFERIEFLSPPLELQNQFAERVAVIEEQKAIAQKSLEQSESLFNSLLQKAFKGELN